MAKRHRVTFGQRAFNAVVIALNRAGVRLGPFALLTVTGRTTGKPLTLSVAPLSWSARSCWQIELKGGRQ